MSDDASFGEWIKQQRKALGLNQVALAQQIGCPRRTLGKIEAEAQRPSGPIIERLAQALKVPPTVVQAKELRTAGERAYDQRNYAQAQQDLEQALALYRELGDKPAIAALVSKLGWALAEQDNYLQVDSLFEEHLALQQELGNQRGIVWACNFLGVMSLRQGKYQRAATFYEQGLALCRKLELKRGAGMFLNTLGYTLGKLGDYPRAATLLEEGLSISREMGDAEGSAECLGNLAHVVLEQGDTARAAELGQQSLILLQEVGAEETEIAESLDEMAEVARRQGDARRAACLLGAAETLREGAGAAILPSKRDTYERTISATRADLDEAAFAAAWAEGRKMNLEQGIDYALNRKDHVVA